MAKSIPVRDPPGTPTSPSVHQLVGEPTPVRDPPGTPTRPSTNIVTLAGGQSDDGLPQDKLDQRAYIEAAYATRRHPDQVVILLVGHNGHGKSKTINRLFGQNILEVGRSSSGSTTKVCCVFRTYCSIFTDPLPRRRLSSG